MNQFIDEILITELEKKNYTYHESIEIVDDIMQQYKAKHLSDYGQSKSWFINRNKTLIRYINIYYNRMK